jgi:glycosyltransferase involved in cell wall biosynthesis
VVVTELGRRPKVVQLVTRLNIGGPARHVLSLARDLDDQVDMVVAAGRSPVAEGLLEDPQVPVRPVPLVRPIRPHVDAAAVRSIRRLLRDEAPDILHTHMAKAGTVGRMAARSMRARPRTVHTFHGHVLDGYFSPPLQQAFIRAERALARHTDVLVAVSEEIRDQLLGLGIGRAEQYEVIPVGVDLDAYLAVDEPSGRLRRELGLQPETPLVGILARLAPVKDHDTLFRALTALDGVHLAVLGDGELRAALQRAVSSYGLDGRVHFTGWWDDIPAALADIDVVALTSKNEGTPVALMEAAAAARPIVATNVGGVGRIVKDASTGYLVPAGNHLATAARLQELIDDRSRRRELGAQGRSLVRERFASDTATDALAELYARLSSRR